MSQQKCFHFSWAPRTHADKVTAIGSLAAFVVFLTACGGELGKTSRMASPIDPCALVLMTAAEGQRVDWQIQSRQQQVRESRQPSVKLESLGWLYVSRARTTHDPGFYKLAEQTAACMKHHDPDSAAALLLRGHVLQNLHRFQEAEELARRLVAQRESPFDHGLLGDSLMEQGRLNEAADAYQKMVDLRPGLESYSRAAHMRWLHGDLRGARDLMHLALRAGSDRNPEPVAWVYSRLAMLELQAGEFERAAQSAQDALRLQPEYAPALLAQGRILLAQGEAENALQPLTRAAKLSPLAEYEWLLAEALRAAGHPEKALLVEAKIECKGSLDDPRTVSLYLATRRLNTEAAVRLAERELKNRSDVFAYDALAWSLHAAGETKRANVAMKQALSAGTQDARLFLHAALIAAASGETTRAEQFLRKAESLRSLLLPSELQWLDTARRSPPGSLSSSSTRVVPAG